MIASILLSALLFITSPAQRPVPPPEGQPGQQRSPEAQPRQDAPRPADRAPDNKDRPAPPPEQPPVVTKHEINAGGRLLKYTVTTGLMPIRNQQGETEANIFFVAYTLDGTSNVGERPLMFSFNGGPGSSSVWLHLGALGPKRVKMLDDGSMPPPPYQLVDNPQTWLDQTDLVFIDPVGTGYSRAAKPELAQKFFGVRGDMESVGEFIRMYLTRFERWSSPLFLVGESYGTTRASALSGYLVDKGIAFNGVILISTVMNFQTVRFAQGNDLPIILILPSYAATAWYHKKLPPDLQKRELRKVLEEIETWAAGEYTVALGKGDALTASERKAVIDKLSRYTGLDAGYIDQCNLRVDLSHFNKELLRSDKRTSGRLDSRFKGIDASAVSERPDSDPSNNAIRPPYTAAFNNYVRTELGYKSDLEYFILGGGVGRWDWGVDNGYADTSEYLRNAFSKNPYLRVMVAAGYYDMATPYFAMEYTLNHMNLDSSQRNNIKVSYYEAGHMMYIDLKSLARLKEDVASFLRSAMTRP